MFFAKLKRWFSRSKSTSNRPSDGAENLFIVPVVAPVGAIHPSDSESDDSEAVEGNSVETDSIGGESFGGESSCGTSCGAMFP